MTLDRRPDPGPHLGAAATELVDGRLGGWARDRALGHIAGCADCRAEVEAQRQLKHALGRIPSPHQPDGLTARLLTLSSGPGLSPGPARVARSVAAGRAPVAPFGVAAFAATSSPRSAAVVADRGRSRPFLLTGIALGVLGGGLALGLGSVDSAGSGGGSGPVVSPVFTSFNTGELPPMTTRYVDPDLPVVATLLGR